MRPEDEEGVRMEITHTPLGEGTVDWKKFFADKKRYSPAAPMIIELPEDDAIKSIDYLLELK
jgi:sugar phosphate isomerase/epimerase